MKTRIAMIAAQGALSLRRQRASRAGRAAGDLALVAIALGLAALFLWHNGFIGNGDIQPYPY
jgi:hypothetical protein